MVGYDVIDWLTRQTSKDLFVMGVVVVEVIVIENKIYQLHDVAN